MISFAYINTKRFKNNVTTLENRTELLYGSSKAVISVLDITSL
jgi:hypothetical protein